MRIGFLGVGRIGSSHAEVVARHPEVKGLVLADADVARARGAAERLGCEHVGSPDEVFRAGVDAVVIASATDTHADLLLAALERDLPAFCEKPVALDVGTTRAVLKRVDDAGAAVQIGLQRRFDHGYRTARRALADGRIGDLHRVHQITGDPAPPHPEYIPASGGMYRDCHIHDFDILRWVTGREVVDVYATGSNRGADFFAAAGDVDNTAALLTLDDGTLVTLQGSRYNGAGHDVRMELAGTEATYVVGLDERSPWTSAEREVSFPDGDPWPNFWVRFTPAYVDELNAFVEVAKGAAASPCTVSDALQALYVAEAAELSRAERRRVEVEEVRV
jgi:myo-inositol 2-dehydrogenase / D-chiro-inositol 1-dehydrogenase